MPRVVGAVGLVFRDLLQLLLGSIVIKLFLAVLAAPLDVWQLQIFRLVRQGQLSLLDRLVDGFGGGPGGGEGLGLEGLLAPGLLARTLSESLLALVLVGSASVLCGLVASRGLSQGVLPGKAAVYGLGVGPSWMPLVPGLVEQIIQVLALVAGAARL